VVVRVVDLLETWFFVLVSLCAKGDLGFVPCFCFDARQVERARF
jgi:hypothetical protein